MGIELRSLQFDNLLVHETKQLRENWQEGIFIMEDFTLNEDVYQNGPIFFSVAPELNEPKFGHFTYYLPINTTVGLSDETYFYFLDRFDIEKAFALRQADQEADFYAAHKKIKDYANDQQVELEEMFYCFLLEVYGEIIIDLYVPLKERSTAL
ncbi:hypothetical protein [Pueribacillus sp. YX66]|uniref:hypothetical protein n=1 Tax=Pueribacillus sp. YX66 TaxID=3229242 RepID=UPI00358D8818